MDTPAAIAGMFTAMGVFLFLAALGAAGAGGLAFQVDTVDVEGAVEEISLVGGILALVGLFVAFLVGGWAAGRMARYDGGLNGAMTAFWMLLIVIFAALGAWIGGVQRVRPDEPARLGGRWSSDKHRRRRHRRGPWDRRDVPRRVRRGEVEAYHRKATPPSPMQPARTASGRLIAPGRREDPPNIQSGHHDNQRSFRRAPFGSVFAAQMALTTFEGDRFEAASMRQTGPIELHPGAHVLHYASSCFEGLKAYRGADGTARIFRLGAHIARMEESARLLCLPVPPADLLRDMVIDTVAANQDEIPEAPGSLYLRPTLVGTTANVGAAASPPTEGLLYVSPARWATTSPAVSGRFAWLSRPRRCGDTRFRQGQGGGQLRGGAPHRGCGAPGAQADQVLFAPGGDVQETGASNFLLLDDRRVLTKPLDSLSSTA